MNSGTTTTTTAAVAAAVATIGEAILQLFDHQMIVIVARRIALLAWFMEGSTLLPLQYDQQEYGQAAQAEYYRSEPNCHGDTATCRGDMR